MVSLFNTILYQPIYNLLIGAYNIIPGQDIGLAIIFITIVVKIVLLPFSKSALKSQKVMQDLQPKLDELKAKCGNDKEMLAKETMKLYKENKVNPLSSCLPLLIQLPILIAVYRAFQVGLTSEHFDLLYPFVQNPGHINSIAFGFLDMAKASFPLAILSGLAQYVQTEMLMAKKPKAKDKGAKDEAMLASMNKSMQYFMPFMTIIIGMSLPAGLTFYWFLTTVLTVLQQKFIFQKKLPVTTEAQIKNTPNETGEKIEVEIIPPKK
ncbi:MAG: YidC/Oxa1 family membrane protein insertase [Patescibacteria group bacterium]